MKTQPALILTPRHEPSAFPPSQLKKVSHIAHQLGRGAFVYLEDPEDGD